MCRVIRRSHKRRLLFALPREFAREFDDLLQAWDEGAVRVTVLPYVGSPKDVAASIDGMHDVDAVLLAGNSRFAPATVLPGPFLMACDGRRVPAAWLPLANAGVARRFAATAARVHHRVGQRAAIAVLAQWHPRYLRLADRIEQLLQPRSTTFRWTADVIGRHEVVNALGSGLGLGLYVGHGRAMGWVGYHGMRAHHFDSGEREPLGALISLCCRTASRRRVGMSYAERLTTNGVAAASFGAVGDTLHMDNTRWAVGLCDALATGVETVGELIARGAPPSPDAYAAYRLIGDPCAPLVTDYRAVRRAAAVPTYP
ncbi:MAG TPA: C25 family cysteine peptidase [Povalibacter sp.]|nr:C25 family cysteine peptidase [Povalibacter sp.]